jgi:hypothetical protein
MRAPQPTQPSDADAARVVRKALVHSFGFRDLQLAEQVNTNAAAWTETGAIAAAERGNFRPLANLLEHHPQSLGAQARALIAARLRGEFKGKRGQPKRKLAERSFNYVLALEFHSFRKFCVHITRTCLLPKRGPSKLLQKFSILMNLQKLISANF